MCIRISEQTHYSSEKQMISLSMFKFGRLEKNLTKLSLIGIASLSGISLSASSALAANIFVFGDRFGDKTNLVNNLNLLGGNTVTTDTFLPADLSTYDTVWQVSAFSPLEISEQERLANFLAQGGGLHLTGERPCCEAQNDSIEAFINSVVKGGGVTVGDQGDISGPYAFNPEAAGNLTKDPNTIVNWNPSASGGLGGTSLRNTLAFGAGGAAVGGVWDSMDLVGNSGRLTLLMDVNWFSTTGREAPIENIQTFLSGAAVSQPPQDVPTPALLPGVIGMGIAALRKRKQKAVAEG